MRSLKIAVGDWEPILYLLFKINMQYQMHFMFDLSLCPLVITWAVNLVCPPLLNAYFFYDVHCETQMLGPWHNFTAVTKLTNILIA